jgi:hypothetical protein
MTKSCILCALALGVVVPLAVSSATANADDYAGLTYGAASERISDAGGKAVISTRSGDGPTTDKCLVTHAQAAPWIKGEHFQPIRGTVLLNLECGADVATAKKSGNSAASPQGRAALAEAKRKADKR